MRRLLHLLALFATPAFADGLIDNLNLVSVDPAGRVSRFYGMTVTKDGKIGRVLQRGDKPGKVEWRVDGGGRNAIAGLIDAHGHVIELGFATLTLDLSATTSLADAQAKIAAYAAANPNRRWIVGRGWNQEKWGLGRFPTAADLDAAVRDRPVWLVRADGHAGWANSAAIAAAGVAAATPSPAGGRIELAAGKPAGVFVDAAQALIAGKIPAPLAKERDLAFVRAQDDLLSKGITAIADMGTTDDDWNAFRRAGDEGRLNIRIFSYALGLEPMLKIAGGVPTQWLYGDKLHMGGVKLYLDGALGSRGACLKRDYADAPGQRGQCFIDDTKLKNIMVRITMDGFQVAMHAIGDKANAQALDAIEALADTYKGDRRWRIEHAQIVDPADIPRFGRNGVIASMQPVHQTSDRQMAEARLGPDRLRGAYAWASIAATGAKLAFGSDVPVESADPFAGIAAAVSRQGADGQPAGGWQPQERVTREAALAGFTSGAAYAAFAEKKVGQIAPGFAADFVVIDRDPLAGSAADVRATQVLETWVAGQRVYKRGERSGR